MLRPHLAETVDDAGACYPFSNAADLTFHCSSVSGRPRHDLHWLRVPHDLPEAIWVQQCGYQFASGCLWTPVGPPHAGHLAPRRRQDQNQHF